jgi:hypothetical protein
MIVSRIPQVVIIITINIVFYSKGKTYGETPYQICSEVLTNTLTGFRLRLNQPSSHNTLINGI